jgi:tetratricopeptide (TPR) repeat protein
MDQKMYGAAEDKLAESLSKDSNYLPALVKMAELLYRNMRYTEALKISARALSIDTHAGDANYYYGIINAQLGNIADAKDGFSIASLTPEYRSAAYTGLSKLYSKEKDFHKAIAYTVKAIDFNRYNIDALMLQAAALRSNNEIAKAETVLKTILLYDPLNHFARFEKYLWQQTEEAKKEFVSLVRNELPAETFAELAIWYYNAGYTDEALKVFSLSQPGAEAILWQAFLQNKKADCNAIDP